MKRKKTRPCHNIGKPEFIAGQKKIETLLAAGYDRKYIHATLKSLGVLTMSYSTFCAHFKKFKQNGAASTEPRLAGSFPGGASPKFALRTGAGLRSDKSEPFSIDRSRPVEELM